MDVVIGPRIAVKNYKPCIEQWCNENLIIKNPDFYKLERLGKWTGGTPREIALYERRAQWLLLPYGVLDKFLLECGPAESVEMRFNPLRRVAYNSTINLYPYQARAVETALKKQNGVVVMPCGAGKTQTALEIIARIGGRALWLTHTQDLLNQSMARAKSVFDLPYNSYGTITAGKVNIGTAITFATVQTMSKIDLSQHTHDFDVVVVDECQHACGSPTRVTQFYKVVNSLSARYKFGLTATPKRADGLERSMFALLGGVIHEVTREEVEETTCPVQVEQVRTGYYPDCDFVLAGDGTINYSALVQDLVEDRARFEKVHDEARSYSRSGPTLFLASRVEYLNRMTVALEKDGLRVVCLSALGNSKAAKAYRKEVLQDLNGGKLDCVLATYQLAKEGLDVPNLRFLILATPEKDETTVIQAAGRVGRKSEGKEKGCVIDFVDDFGMYLGWAKKRRGYYKKLGYTLLT